MNTIVSLEGMSDVHVALQQDAVWNFGVVGWVSPRNHVGLLDGAQPRLYVTLRHPIFSKILGKKGGAM